MNVCEMYGLCPETVRKLESLIQQGAVSFEPDRWNRGDIRLQAVVAADLEQD